VAIGPGKYDSLATYVRKVTNAHAAIVIVVDGTLGSGISVQARNDSLPPQRLAMILEDTAHLIRSSIE
jgi:hypothetical protein